MQNNENETQKIYPPLFEIKSCQPNSPILHLEI